MVFKSLNGGRSNFVLRILKTLLVVTFFIYCLKMLASLDLEARKQSKQKFSQYQQKMPEDFDCKADPQCSKSCNVCCNIPYNNKGKKSKKNDKY